MNIKLKKIITSVIRKKALVDKPLKVLTYLPYHIKKYKKNRRINNVKRNDRKRYSD